MYDTRHFSVHVLDPQTWAHVTKMERERERERGREDDSGKNTPMEKNYFHNLRLAPQEKNSDFQEAVLHLIISERKRRLIRDKLLQRTIPGVCFRNKILV